MIDDISVLAVEECLIEKLPALFSAEDVLDIDDTMVVILASEDEESSAERTRCNEKLKVLEDGLKELRSVQEYSSILKGMIMCGSTERWMYNNINQKLLPKGIRTLRS
jgi:hypothetical protein